MGSAVGRGRWGGVVDWSRLSLPAGARHTSGGEVHFPCPLNPDSRADAAWVVPDGGAHGPGPFCRKCGDGSGALTRAEWEQHARALGIWDESSRPGDGTARRSRSTSTSGPSAGPRVTLRSRPFPRESGRRHRGRPPRHRSQGSPDPSPGRVWVASVPADGTAGAAYLVGRAAWTAGVALPASVRWIGAAEYSALGAWPRPPGGCVGLLVYGFAMPGDATTAAVQIEAVNAAGLAVAFVGRDGGKRKRPSVQGSRFADGARVFVSRSPSPGGGGLAA